MRRKHLRGWHAWRDPQPGRFPWLRMLRGYRLNSKKYCLKICGTEKNVQFRKFEYYTRNATIRDPCTLHSRTLNHTGVKNKSYMIWKWISIIVCHFHTCWWPVINMTQNQHADKQITKEIISNKCKTFFQYSFVVLIKYLMSSNLKMGYIEFKYYADAIDSGLTPPG